jgi:hypothetical protein
MNIWIHKHLATRWGHALLSALSPAATVNLQNESRCKIWAEVVWDSWILLCIILHRPIFIVFSIFICRRRLLPFLLCNLCCLLFFFVFLFAFFLVVTVKVLTAASIKMASFWEKVPSNLVEVDYTDVSEVCTATVMMGAVCTSMKVSLVLVDVSLNCGHQRANCTRPRWCMNMEPWWNDTDRKTRRLGEKLVPMKFCPPQILHGLTWRDSGPPRWEVGD